MRTFLIALVFTVWCSPSLAQSDSTLTLDVDGVRITLPSSFVSLGVQNDDPVNRVEMEGNRISFAIFADSLGRTVGITIYPDMSWWQRVQFKRGASGPGSTPSDYMPLDPNVLPLRDEVADAVGAAFLVSRDGRPDQGIVAYGCADGVCFSLHASGPVDEPYETVLQYVGLLSGFSLGDLAVIKNAPTE